MELYDFGISEDGGFYYVMELLDGINLETLVKQFGPQTPARVVHILRQVCESLAEADRLGLVHPDIKPTNIFLCRMGIQYDFTKVLDFGLVKTELGEGETRMTMEGTTTGTPAYMPPELVLGNSQVDGRADLYGLGCVAYWLLTGSLVFEEKNPMKCWLTYRTFPILLLGGVNSPFQPRSIGRSWPVWQRSRRTGRRRGASPRDRGM